mmetsp:Transcript_27146/g.20313  ORF Transcript_27146/g.20313 Transcript_27146/m.20313 type:complete len:118 (+) Transcript_27146:1-354(+)
MESTYIKAGDRITIGSEDKQRNLSTQSKAFNIGVNSTTNERIFTAAKSGILVATDRALQKKSTRRGLVEVDIVPICSYKYFPQKDDMVIGIVVMKNPEFYTLDINADSLALLPTMEF